VFSRSKIYSAYMKMYIKSHKKL